MLIILPPSESKRPPPEHGQPLALGSLSFPVLTGPREQVLDALVVTSGGADATRRLLVRPSLAADVARNIRVRESPAIPVLDLYAGSLYDGLDAASLSSAATERAANGLVVTSALWGLLRPTDRIPNYRLNVCAHLVGIERLEPFWRAVLGDTLAEAAGPDGIVLDLRSPGYQAMGMPTGRGDRTVTLRVERADVAGRPIGAVVAKRVRGQAARALLASGAEPSEPADVAELLAEQWPVRLEAPARPGRSWVLTLTSSE